MPPTYNTSRALPAARSISAVNRSSPPISPPTLHPINPSSVRSIAASHQNSSCVLVWCTSTSLVHGRREGWCAWINAVVSVFIGAPSVLAAFPPPFSFPREAAATRARSSLCALCPLSLADRPFLV